jgi:hypothetical protein
MGCHLHLLYVVSGLLLCLEALEERSGFRGELGMLSGHGIDLLLKPGNLLRYVYRDLGCYR